MYIFIFRQVLKKMKNCHRGEWLSLNALSAQKPNKTARLRSRLQL
jgi:hypothetical protein